MKKLVWLLTVCLLSACYSNNCPMENTVLCNYYFYDQEGTAVTFTNYITVTTLKPGSKTVYIYKKLGEITIEKDSIDSVLIKDGYTMSERVQRKDTVLLNKLTNAKKMSVPMSYFNQTDTLVVAYSNLIQKDTIYIEKDSYPHVEQPECGAHRFHNLKGIRSTNAAIDHIEIANPLVNYEGAENVKLFFNGVAQ